MSSSGSFFTKLTRSSSDSESHSSSSESHNLFRLLRRHPKPNARRSAAIGLTLSSLDPVSPRSIDTLQEPRPVSRGEILPLGPGTSGREKLIATEAILKQGVPALRFTHKKKSQRVLKISLADFTLSWTRDNRKSTNSLSIANIKQIRTGADAKNYREEFKVSAEFAAKWVTIIYLEKDMSKLKALHLVMSSEKDLSSIVGSLNSVITFQRELINNFLLDDNFLALQLGKMGLEAPEAAPGDSSEREIDLMDIVTGSLPVLSPRPQKSCLTFEDTLKITRQLHINLSEQYLRKIFSQIDTGKGYLDFCEFKEFVRVLKKRSDVGMVFRGLNYGPRLYFQGFLEFLVRVQQEYYDVEYAYKLFRKFAEPGDEPYMTAESFNNYLMSNYSSHLKSIPEDMTRPLNEYFISSSHNTYLLGRQVGGESLVELYIKALQRGCRCVEIDIWDDVTGTVPIVSHGRSFTSPIDLLLVIEAIRKYAFITTPFPLILSLEVHCSPANQLQVKTMMQEVFGEMLVMAPLDGVPKLPSPLDLKHKILVKVKKHQLREPWGSSFSSTSTASAFEELKTTSTEELRLTVSATSTHSEDLKFAVGSLEDQGRFIRKRRLQGIVTEELSALGVYVLGQKFNNFSLPESKTFNHCFSFNEKKLNSLLKDTVKRESVDKHNITFLMRVYPSRFRLASSNFSPVAYWAHGVQMVSTNWQTYDVGQQINEAMFSVGLKAGYLLKPKSLRTPRPKTRRRSVACHQRRKITLTVDIISGQQIPKPKEFKYDDEKINPYVELQVFGFTKLTITSHRLSDMTQLACLSDKRGGDDEGKDGMVNAAGSLPFATPTVFDNGFNPIWNTRFVATIEALNDLVFIRFMVKSGDAQIGLLMVKLDYLSKGIRYLPIFDLSGEEYIFSSLLVKIDYEIEVM
ncbi:hypothetical protein BABINDRAFT_163089, partial [Babjeviella inositovora NRRL Y-12698]